MADKYKTIKKLIWLYFWLWLFEGALRKWFLPQLQAPLLIVRDPLVLIIYILAISKSVFPKNIFVISLFLISLLISVIHILMAFGSQYENMLWIVLYGMRTNFLHPYLIFLIPKVFCYEDIKKVGKWILALALPMAVLAIMQFRSPMTAWINAGAGEGEIGQLTAMGRARAATVFSFITGTISYASVLAAFVLFGAANKGVYKRWILICGTVGLVLLMISCGSRALIFSVLVVLAMLLFALTIKQKYLNNLASYLFLVIPLIFLVQTQSFFQESVGIMQSRFEQAGGLNTFEPVYGRVISGFVDPFSNINGIPFLGYGLGIGTNVGARLYQGSAGFVFSEGEWGRIMDEVGFCLGFLFILWRVLLTAWLGWFSLKKATHFNILPILLFGACITDILIGQWSRPSTVGYAAMVAGFCLAAGNRLNVPQKNRPA